MRRSPQDFACFLASSRAAFASFWHWFLSLQVRHLPSNVNRFKRTIFYTDAIGLGLFTALGIEISLRSGLNDTYSLIMGVITATFGGLIADIFCNAVPNLFKRGELYATACAIGGALYMLMKQLSLFNDINLAVCVVSVVGIRIYSKRKRLMLPDI